MDLSPNTLDYLHGKRFSNGLAFDLGNRGAALRRSEYLVALATGQRVLHIGCCDHLPLIRDKLAQGIYLHDNLSRVATQCVGVDTNAEGVALLRSLGFDQTYLPDEVPAPESGPAIEPPFDICLVADVVEHVGDPAAFLASMLRYRFKRLVVSTPNGFRWRNALPGPELINTDHRYWFTPYTLCKVLVDAGYQPEQVALCHGDYTTWKGALAARLMGRVPRWRESLIVHARPMR